MNPVDIRDKALNLRESVNSSRARMSAHQERLEKLRRDIEELRALVGSVPPAPAAKPVSVVKSAPASKAAAPVSAAGAVPFKAGESRGNWKPVPYIAIFFFAVGMQLHASRHAAPALVLPAVPAAAVPPATAPAPADDAGADEALLLTHEYRLPGDERPLSERLGPDTNPPGAEPQWTAERTGERTYRVSFKQNRADAGYDFDVDLDARRVEPTPETATLIAPRLVSRR